jgi:hypothetical protein
VFDVAVVVVVSDRFLLVRLGCKIGVAKYVMFGSAQPLAQLFGRYKIYYASFCCLSALYYIQTESNLVSILGMENI